MKKVIIVIVALCSGLGALANARDLYLEAERADWFTAPLKLVTGSGQASDGMYIETDEDAGDQNSNPPAEDNGWIVHTIYLPAGDYRVTVRLAAEDEGPFNVAGCGHVDLAAIVFGFARSERHGYVLFVRCHVAIRTPAPTGPVSGECEITEQTSGEKGDQGMSLHLISPVRL